MKRIPANKSRFGKWIQSLTKCGVLLFPITLFLACDGPTRSAHKAFIASSKSAMQPEVLQKEAAGILSKAATGDTIPIADLPAALTNFPAGPPQDAMVGTWGDSQEKGLMLIWGGGFAHWGLIIGGPRFAMPDVDYLETSRWSSNVIFFYQIR